MRSLGLVRSWLVAAALIVACEAPTRAQGPAPAEDTAERTRGEPGVAGSPGPVARALPGHEVELGVLGDAHHGPRRVHAWVPDAAPGTRMPVLYVNDGQAALALFRIDRAIAELVAEGAIEPWIVVAIDATEARRRELAERTDLYADFVADVVAPAVAAALPVRAGPEHAAMLGYSYGGLAAVRVQTERPDAIGRVVAMSPSLWFGARGAIDAFRRARGARPVRMWIDIGSEEGRPGEAIPYMVRDVRALRDAAIARGMRFGSDLGCYEAIGERHDMLAGARRMRTALAFALSSIDLAERAPREVLLTRYPPPRSGLGTASVEARYEGALRLSWPLALVARDGDRPVRGERVSERASAIVGGVAARDSEDGAR